MMIVSEMMLKRDFQNPSQLIKTKISHLSIFSRLNVFVCLSHPCLACIMRFVREPCTIILLSGRMFTHLATHRGALTQNLPTP
jgi:hypothetical protein